MTQKTRVADGVRTRDNRNHNPAVKKTLRTLSSISSSPGLAKRRPDSPVLAPGPETEPESSVLRKVQEALWAAGGVHVMRNNAGSHRRKKPIEVGSSDLICIVAPYGRWLCIETKRPKGGTEADHQKTWLTKMRNYGAVAGFVRTPEEALELLAQAQKPAFAE